jgi:hypothetical protein
MGLLLVFIALIALYIWFMKTINDIDRAYKAGCTLADPDGSRARARKKYYGF